MITDVKDIQSVKELMTKTEQELRANPVLFNQLMQLKDKYLKGQSVGCCGNTYKKAVDKLAKKCSIKNKAMTVNKKNEKRTFALRKGLAGVYKTKSAHFINSDKEVYDYLTEKGANVAGRVAKFAKLPDGMNFIKGVIEYETEEVKEEVKEEEPKTPQAPEQTEEVKEEKKTKKRGRPAKK